MLIQAFLGSRLNGSLFINSGVVPESWMLCFFYLNTKYLILNT